MRHARSDYDPIQDPREDGIPDDEPVFLLRAQDLKAPAVVDHWVDLYLSDGGDPNVADAVLEHAEAMRRWQAQRKVKFPDVPDGAIG